MTTPTTAAEPVLVPGAPPIPGLVFRHFAGSADYAAMVDVVNAAHEADHVEEVVTVGQLAAEIEHPSHFDPRRDVLIAEVDGRLVAHSRSTWAERSDGVWTYDAQGHVTPAYRRRGIGRAMLHWNERHHREEVAPAHGVPAARRVFGCWAMDGEVGSRALLLAEGYAPERFFFEMVRPTLDDVPDLGVPSGIELRGIRGDAGRDAEVRRALVAENEAFRDHWGHREATEEDWAAHLATPEVDPALWVVAWDGGEIAGVSINTVWSAENEAFGRERFWVDSLSVRRAWRRRGLARALLAESFRRLRERGMTSAALGVDAANPSGALGLYESLGFEVVKRAAVYWKPME